MTTSAPRSAPPADLPQFLRTPAASAGQTAARPRGWRRLRIRLLPLLMIASCLLLGLKAVSIAAGAADLMEDKTKDAPAAAPEAAPEPVSTPASAPAKVAEEAAAPDFMSRSELELLQDLAARRQELEGRSEELDTRERLLLATERRIDGKIERLKSIEGRIKDLLQLQSEQEEAQLTSLVNIYEKMKPEDAAVILEKLEMNILVKVIQRMNNRKLALVMAEMNPEMAKKVTVELATRKELPPIEG